MNIIPFSQITLKDLPEVGGKNASLGEMYRNLKSKGILVPNGFVITANAFKEFIKSNQIEHQLKNLLDSLDTVTFNNLAEIGSECRKLVMNAKFSDELSKQVLENYHGIKALHVIIMKGIKQGLN